MDVCVWSLKRQWHIVPVHLCLYFCPPHCNDPKYHASPDSENFSLPLAGFCCITSSPSYILRDMPLWWGYITHFSLRFDAWVGFFLSILRSSNLLYEVLTSWNVVFVWFAVLRLPLNKESFKGIAGVKHWCRAHNLRRVDHFVTFHVTSIRPVMMTSSCKECCRSSTSTTHCCATKNFGTRVWCLRPCSYNCDSHIRV